MKSWILNYILMPLIAMSVVAGCSDKQESNTNSGVATVPPPTNCVDGTTYCNSNQYGGNAGFSAYPNNPYFYSNSYSYGGFYGNHGNFHGGYYGNFCDCPDGSRPVYNGQFGLGCVSTISFQASAGGAVYWGLGANNNQWVNIPQISNSQGYPNKGCYQNVAQSCFVDQVNSCGAGLTCQTTGGGSRLGICIGKNSWSGATSPSAGRVGGYR